MLLACLLKNSDDLQRNGMNQKRKGKKVLKLGIEPKTFALLARRSNQLSYSSSDSTLEVSLINNAQWILNILIDYFGRCSLALNPAEQTAVQKEDDSWNCIGNCRRFHDLVDQRVERIIENRQNVNTSNSNPQIAFAGKNGERSNQMYCNEWQTQREEQDLSK